MQTMYVKPNKSQRLNQVLVVRQPERGGEPLPEAGAHVPRGAYWLRRLREGSVVEAKPPRPSTKKRGSDEE